MQFMLKEFKEKCVVLDDENKIYPFLICGVKISLYFLSNYKGIHLQPMTYFYFEREKMNGYLMIMDLIFILILIIKS